MSSNLQTQSGSMEKHSLLKKMLLLTVVFLAAIGGTFAQTAAPLSKFITPTFISGCNNDTIRIEVNNIYGAKDVTYNGKVKINVAIPGSPTIKFVGGSVLKLNPLLQFTATVAYSTPYPIVGETINVNGT